MSGRVATNVYHEVLEIFEDYLGPAAIRFVDRQITNHLNKKPMSLARKDIPVLISWSKVSLALLTDNHQVVDECIERLKTLQARKA